MLEKEIEVTKIATDLNYLERKNIQLRGEIQCLNDRIAGLVKENNALKREAMVRRIFVGLFDRVKRLAIGVKGIWRSLPPSSMKENLLDDSDRN